MTANERMKEIERTLVNRIVAEAVATPAVEVAVEELRGALRDANARHSALLKNIAEAAKTGDPVVVAPEKAEEPKSFVNTIRNLFSRK